MMVQGCHGGMRCDGARVSGRSKNVCRKGRGGNNQSISQQPTTTNYLLNKVKSEWEMIQ